ncbi:MAG: hypothetical protein ACRD50_07715 [Candidatus Acidiferrales bacterium]
MSELRLILEYIGTWFQKGILIKRLRAREVTGPDAWKRALSSFSVGSFIAALINSLVVLLFQKQHSFVDVLGFPVLIVTVLLASGSFLGLLIILLKVFQLRLKLAVVASSTWYVLSGAIPILSLLLHEQMSEAIRLFIKFQDPSLPYLASATQRLLNPEQVSISVVRRTWIFVALELATGIWYIIWSLGRLLVESATGRGKIVKVALSLAIALVLNDLFSESMRGDCSGKFSGGCSHERCNALVIGPKSRDRHPHGLLPHAH